MYVCMMVIRRLLQIYCQVGSFRKLSAVFRLKIKTATQVIYSVSIIIFIIIVLIWSWWVIPLGSIIISESGKCVTSWDEHEHNNHNNEWQIKRRMSSGKNRNKSFFRTYRYYLSPFYPFRMTATKVGVGGSLLFTQVGSFIQYRSFFQVRCLV